MYEVGDKVIYQGADKNAYKKVGVLKSIEEKDGKPQLTVEFEGGETFTAPVDDWSKEFANAVTNAEFKVGDFVKIISGDMKGQRAVITKITGDVVEVKDNDGYKWEVGQEDIVANSCPCTSTNSVVRNAMAANRRVARNADKLDKRFGNVRVLAYEDGGLGVRYVIDIGGIVEFANAVSWNDAGKKCAEDARHTASLFEKRASLLRQAATWLEQNAK